MSEVTLKYFKLTNDAFAPTRGSERAAGFDLKSPHDYKVPPQSQIIIKTDLQIQLPKGTYGRIAARSKFSAKNFISIGAGVIDEDYRGNVSVLLLNHSKNAISIKRGDSFAQLICERIYYPVLVEEAESLPQTERNYRGILQHE